MSGSTTYIKTPDNPSDTKTFVFDYSFWSHDKYIVDPDGIYTPIDQKYADQKKVYSEIGSDILVNAWYFVYVMYLGKDIIVACLRMGKLGLENRIVCWGMGLTVV